MILFRTDNTFVVLLSCLQIEKRCCLYINHRWLSNPEYKHFHLNRSADVHVLGELSWCTCFWNFTEELWHSRGEMQTIDNGAFIYNFDQNNVKYSSNGWKLSNLFYSLRWHKSQTQWYCAHSTATYLITTYFHCCFNPSHATDPVVHSFCLQFFITPVA